MTRLQEVVDLSARSSSNIAIPSHCMVFAVCVRVVEQIEGAGSFAVGVAGDSARYGSNLPAAIDTTNVGLSQSPHVYWSDENIIFSPAVEEQEITAGKIDLCIDIMQFRGNWNW